MVVAIQTDVLGRHGYAFPTALADTVAGGDV